MKYFNGVKTLEELKRLYHKLAVQLHPEMGGNLEDMQELNAEYDAMFDRVKNTHVNKEGKVYTAVTNEAPEYFRDIINELLKMANVTIEVIGAFIWVYGDTKPHKEQLKAMNFKWHAKKGCWYLAPEWYRKYNRRQYTMDDLRDMYWVSYVGHGARDEEDDTKPRITA